jgi:hypothetical protein
MFTPEELQQAEIFSCLDEAECARLAQTAADVRLKPGDWLARHGETPWFYVIFEGRLRIVIDVHGKQTEFAEHEFKEGDFLGEVPLLLGTSSRIENYLGFPEGISGEDLTGRGFKQATRAKGEDRLLGHGVFCGAARQEATNVVSKKIFIVGGGNSAGQAAMFLSSYAAEVKVLVRGEGLKLSMSQYLIDQIAWSGRRQHGHRVYPSIPCPEEGITRY